MTTETQTKPNTAYDKDIRSRMSAEWTTNAKENYRRKLVAEIKEEHERAHGEPKGYWCPVPDAARASLNPDIEKAINDALHNGDLPVDDEISGWYVEGWEPLSEMLFGTETIIKVNLSSDGDPESDRSSEFLPGYCELLVIFRRGGSLDTESARVVESADAANDPRYGLPPAPIVLVPPATSGTTPDEPKDRWDEAASLYRLWKPYWMDSDPDDDGPRIGPKIFIPVANADNQAHREIPAAGFCEGIPATLFQLPSTGPWEDLRDYARANSLLAIWDGTAQMDGQPVYAMIRSRDLPLLLMIMAHDDVATEEFGYTWLGATYRDRKEVAV